MEPAHGLKVFKVWRGVIRLLLMLAALALFGCAGTLPDQRASTAAPLHDRQADAQAPETIPVTPEQFPEPVRITHKLVLPSGTQVDVNNPFGDVRLRFNGFENQFEVSAVAQIPEGAAAFELVPQLSAQSVTVKVRLPAGSELKPTQRIDIVVYVPEGHPVRVVTAKGQIEVRGIKAPLDLLSESGNIAIRGVSAPISAETGAGSIEVSLEAAGNTGEQRLVTRTGQIVASFGPDFNGKLALATSALIATEFSVDITPQPGQEPNKRGVAVLGQGGASVKIESKRGEIRLFRRAPYQAGGQSSRQSGGQSGR